MFFLAQNRKTEGIQKFDMLHAADYSTMSLGELNKKMTVAKNMEKAIEGKIE